MLAAVERGAKTREPQWPRGFDGNPLNDELRARGLNSYNKQTKLWDIGGGIGGPLVKDKLCF